MTTTAPNVSITHYRLSRTEYDRAVEAGAFQPEAKLELIDGNLRAMTPEGTAHTTGMHLVADWLRHAFGEGFFVRIQNPLAIDEYSEPEPDVAVVTGTVRDYRHAHPASAVLIVEISHESLQYDRTVKQRLYARCGIPEYWILALPEARLEVYRHPTGDRYQNVTSLAAGDHVAPLARPEARIPVDDLLP